MNNKDKTAFGGLRQAGDLAVKDGGLTKLEYAAIKAMQGILANENCMPTVEVHYSNIAYDAIRMANALLTELEKEQK